MTKDDIARVLREHKVVGWGRDPWTAKCKCGIETIAPVSKSDFMPPNHVAHLADQLAALFAEGQAEALDAAADDLAEAIASPAHQPELVACGNWLRDRAAARRRKVQP